MAVGELVYQGCISFNRCLLHACPGRSTSNTDKNHGGHLLHVAIPFSHSLDNLWKPPTFLSLSHGPCGQSESPSAPGMEVQLNPSHSAPHPHHPPTHKDALREEPSRAKPWNWARPSGERAMLSLTAAVKPERMEISLQWRMRKESQRVGRELSPGWGPVSRLSFSPMSAKPGLYHLQQKES